MPIMISLTHPSPQILDKIEMGVFSISRFLVKSLINKSFYNSRISDDIDGIRTVARPDTSPTDTSPTDSSPIDSYPKDSSPIEQ